MGKADSSDPKKAEKKAAKKAKKEAKKERKEAKRLRKEQKRREKEDRSRSQNQEEEGSPIVQSPKDPVSVVAAKESIFFLKRIEVSLSLLPAAMRNIPAALEDSIRAMILKYTEKVGVLMTFKNIKVISNNGHGIILNELPFLHYRVAFDGLVFSPSVGCTVSVLKRER
jgi:FMN phosphatase YigB (HAD superfamily)